MERYFDIEVFLPSREAMAGGGWCEGVFFGAICPMGSRYYGFPVFVCRFGIIDI